MATAKQGDRLVSSLQCLAQAAQILRAYRLKAQAHMSAATLA